MSIDSRYKIGDMVWLHHTEAVDDSNAIVQVQITDIRELPVPQKPEYIVRFHDNGPYSVWRDEEALFQSIEEVRQHVMDTIDIYAYPTAWERD